ncbi:hypothetical protein L195_g035053, partial [Trifolium pratense]
RLADRIEHSKKVDFYGGFVRCGPKKDGFHGGLKEMVSVGGREDGEWFHHSGFVNNERKGDGTIE